MGKGVGKLRVVVEGTLMRMRDFLLTRDTAGCVCGCQIAKWCKAVDEIRISKGNRNTRRKPNPMSPCPKQTSTWSGMEPELLHREISLMFLMNGEE